MSRRLIRERAAELADFPTRFKRQLATAWVYIETRLADEARKT